MKDNKASVYIEKLSASKRAEKTIYISIFLLILLCNMLTPYHADDYAYHFRFDNSELVDSVSDIIPSMIAHGKILNGRLVAHTLVQFFEMLPKFIFNFVNAAMFAALLRLCCSFIAPNVRNNFALLLVFCYVWLVVPAFGEVFLWLDGSINYLWAVCANLLFLLYYFRYYNSSAEISSFAGKAALIILGFIAGAFQESMATATFVLAAAFLLLKGLYRKEKIGASWIIALLAFACGILFMAIQPGEVSLKLHTLSYFGYYRSFVTVMNVFKMLKVPGLIYVVLFVLCILGGHSKEKLLLSFVFILGFICANGVMLIAPIYPVRCAMPAVIYLIMADVILVVELFDDYRRLISSMAAVIFVATLFWCIYGAGDCAATFMQNMANKRTILEGKEAGQTEFRIPSLYASTKYSVAYGISFPTAEEYGNVYMSQYYGVDSIAGYDFYSEYVDHVHEIG